MSPPVISGILTLTLTTMVACLKTHRPSISNDLAALAGSRLVVASEADEGLG